MCGCIAQLKPEQQANMRKLLTSWRTEAVVSELIIAACEAKLQGGSRAAAPAPAAAPAAAPQSNGTVLAAGGYALAVPAAAAVAAAAAAVTAAGNGDGARTRSQLTPAKRVSV
jgi:hypothetical protein